MPSQGTPCPNIALTPTSIVYLLWLSGCAFKYSGRRWVYMMYHVVQYFSSWLGWTTALGKLRIIALKVVYWAPWSVVIVSPIGESPEISWGLEMEVMAVYCIPFTMSCLLACCFIATLLHSRTILVCKPHILTLIWNRYDIKINEFMFLIHQQELSLVVYRWSVKMGQEASPMHIKYHIHKGGNKKHC